VETESLQDVPNVFAYQRILETEKAGYLIRQWCASNLYDRIRCVYS
jgi:phosphoinositide-3-kinase regulatory subunit 4